MRRTQQQPLHSVSAKQPSCFTFAHDCFTFSSRHLRSNLSVNCCHMDADIDFNWTKLSTAMNSCQVSCCDVTSRWQPEPAGGVRKGMKILSIFLYVGLTGELLYFKCRNRNKIPIYTPIWTLADGCITHAPKKRVQMFMNLIKLTS